MNIVDVWRDVTQRISFHTKETSYEIPEASGIYAWFIPLWIYTDDLNGLLRLVNSIHLYDPISKGEPVCSVPAKFNWDTIQVQLRRYFDSNISDDLSGKWQEMLIEPEKKEAFSRALMEASILLPPLYVGKADNLRERYLQHVNGASREENTFHNRFSEYARSIRLKLLVSDLLFVCIRIDAETSQVLREGKLNFLLEQVIMRLAMPPYSIK
jgi:hypothetical protein